jgi:hypothetical protein
VNNICTSGQSCCPLVDGSGNGPTLH